jgi:hypothetical protein
MATLTRRTVTIAELPEVVRRLSQELISPEVVARRRKLTAEIRELRDKTEPLDADIKDLIRSQRNDEPFG